MIQTGKTGQDSHMKLIEVRIKNADDSICFNPKFYSNENDERSENEKYEKPRVSQNV
jgi:hypothetical protein